VVLNSPMRNLKTRLDSRGVRVPREPPQLAAPHPLPVTMAFIYEGLKRLRAVNAHSQAANANLLFKSSSSFSVDFSYAEETTLRRSRSTAETSGKPSRASRWRRRGAAREEADVEGGLAVAEVTPSISRSSRWRRRAASSPSGWDKAVAVAGSRAGAEAGPCAGAATGVSHEPMGAEEPRGGAAAMVAAAMAAAREEMPKAARGEMPTGSAEAAARGGVDGAEEGPLSLAGGGRASLQDTSLEPDASLDPSEDAAPPRSPLQRVLEVGAALGPVTEGACLAVGLGRPTGDAEGLPLPEGLPSPLKLVLGATLGPVTEGACLAGFGGSGGELPPSPLKLVLTGSAAVSFVSEGAFIAGGTGTPIASSRGARTPRSSTPPKRRGLKVVRVLARLRFSRHGGAGGSSRDARSPMRDGTGTFDLTGGGNGRSSGAAPTVGESSASADASDPRASAEEAREESGVPEYVTSPRPSTPWSAEAREALARALSEVRFGLYKILFCFWACVHESILFFAHPPFIYLPRHRPHHCAI